MRSLIPIAFGTTGAVWGVGYLCRLPFVMAPSSLVLVLMLACLFGGGVAAGRLAGGRFRAGAAVGAVSSLMNLLILGSLVTGRQPNAIVPSALWFVPGSIVASMVLAGAGAALAARSDAATDGGRDWTAAFAKIAAATTFLLVVVGGLVTSQGAGLAVVDWPRSYGYNMFLYPLSRMTGGIYYEHAHRLFGSLVGLTTVAFAAYAQIFDGRRWLKRLSLLAVVLVIAQGILGGLRVTGRFTWSASADATAPNIYLAVIHGVFGQLFFALMVTIAVCATAAWKHARPTISASAGTDRALAWVLLGSLLAQLGLGAALRHLDAALLVHVTVGGLLLPLAIVAGVRSLDPAPELAPLRRSAWTMIALVFLQVLLGAGALVATRLLDQGPTPGTMGVVLATAHQATGALVLASATTLGLWTFRLRAGSGSTSLERAPASVSA